MTKLSKIKRLKVVFFVVAVVFMTVLLLLEVFYPLPMPGFKKDVEKTVVWVQQYEKDNEKLPSSRELQMFTGGDHIQIEYSENNQRYVLSGWDGNNRWEYHPEEKKFTLLPD